MSPCVISPLNLISCLCLLLKQLLTPQMLIYILHSLLLLLIFLPGLSTRKTSFATALPSYPPKSPSPSLIPKQQPASSPTSSSSLPASNPISPSTSPSSLIISKWPASSPSSPSSSSPSSDYLSSSPSLSLPPSSLSSSSSTVLSLPSPTTSPPSFQPIHSTGPPHPPPHQQKVYTLSLSHSSLSILYFNVRSMLSNLSSLTSSVLLSNPDIVCITDTWLSPDILSSDVGISGFILFRAD